MKKASKRWAWVERLGHDVDIASAFGAAWGFTRWKIGSPAPSVLPIFLVRQTTSVEEDGDVN
jgi:hypothetical protein